MKDKPRVVIVSGGSIGDWAAAEIREDDVLIGADRGALHLVRCGFRPELAVGDFDSVTSDELAEIERGSRQFESCDPVYKDLTDTEMAVERALAFSPGEILLMGVLGSRFDHSLANVHLLVKIKDQGISCTIVDRHNELRLALPGQPLSIVRRRFTHVSLLPLTPEVKGITLEGFLYPLEDAVLTMGQSLGISNILQAETGTIRTKDGLLLVIQSMD